MLRGHISEVLAATFTADGHSVVSLGADNTVRKWDTGAGRQIEIRIESFNFLNLVNLANPMTNITNANFGKIHVGATGTSAGSLGQPRTMQFALRYLF